VITVKVPYKTSEDNALAIKDLQRQYSSLVRSAYNRAKEGTSQKDIRLKLKSLLNVSGLGCWLTQCAIMEGLAIFKKNKDKTVIFGGAKNFIQRIKNQITKEEIKEKRLLPINIQGEKNQKGNRSFDFNHLSDNMLIFKVNRTKHLTLELQQMKSNYQKKLQFIEQMSSSKDLTVSVRLNESYVYFIYEEPKEKLELNHERYIGIDLNPNYIGISVKENETILHTECFDFSVLTNKLLTEKLSSDSKRFKYLNNKLKHETILAAKQITLLAKKFNCKFVFIEDLKNISNANLDKGHVLNRLTKNLWKRDYFIQNLTKRVTLLGMKLFKVNPSYSSVIGNCQHSYFDPINASLEVGRRGFNVIILKNKQFYPEFSIKTSLKDLWKKPLSEEVKSWKELFKLIKNSKLRYRVSLEDCDKSFKVFQMDSIKSKVSCYQFA
jgi:IS605 OrfB family transposase